MTEAMRRAALEVIDKGTTTTTHPVPLLFVHGGCHSAWCWDDGFLDHFANRGFRAVALSLRGHGRSSSDKPLHRCSMADFADDVRAVADTMEPAPALIGHSVGGFIVQKYLENHQTPAAVLMASLPPSGARGASVRVIRRHPLVALRSNFTLQPEVVFKPPLTRERLFSSSTPQEIIDACAARLEPESLRALWFDAMFRLPKPDKVSTPVLVLGGAHDGTVTNDDVHATARAYRTNAELFPMGHNMMLEPGWPAVAERIESWLGERGL